MKKKKVFEQRVLKFYSINIDSSLGMKSLSIRYEVIRYKTPLNFITYLGQPSQSVVSK